MPEKASEAKVYELECVGKRENLDTILGSNTLLQRISDIGGIESGEHARTVQRECLGLMLTAATRQPDIMRCSPASIVDCVLKSAELDLPLSNTRGLAYVVPYGKSLTFIPGYRGLCELARRSGLITMIEAHVAYEKDPAFDVLLGTAPVIIHKRLLKGDRGDVIGAYAVATYADGKRQADYMSIDELDVIKNRSKAKGGPWRSDPDEMRKKTVTRRLCKYLPQTKALGKALEYDNEATGIDVGDIPDTAGKAVAFGDFASAPAADEPPIDDTDIDAGDDVLRCIDCGLPLSGDEGPRCDDCERVEMGLGNRGGK